MRIAWRTVGRISERVTAEAQAQRDPLAGLKRLGFDEISVRRGRRYLTVVVCRQRRQLVWAAPAGTHRPSRSSWTCLAKRAAGNIELVSCDMASWITGPVAERCPNAAICLDPWHVVKLATDALDEVRREVWNEARRAGHTQLARQLKGARFALWKTLHNLTERQKLKLAAIQQTNQRLYRAYRSASSSVRSTASPPNTRSSCSTPGWPVPGDVASPRSSAWPRRSPTSAPASRPRSATASPNARVEQVNTQIRLITRRGFGYHSPHAVIALAMLALGGLCPPLPSR